MRCGLGWSGLEPVGEKGSEAFWSTPSLTGRLVYDCHRAPRKLELTFPAEARETLLAHLQVFGPPVTVMPGALTVVDRDGYFRLHITETRVHATLRKSAGRRHVGALMVQLRRAVGELPPHPQEPCRHTEPSGPAGVACLRCLQALEEHQTLSPPDAEVQP
jgi:hypothetical protein